MIQNKAHLIQPHRDYVFALTLIVFRLNNVSLNSIQNAKNYIEIDTYITYSPPWMSSLIRNIKRSFIKVVMGLGKKLR
jgi:hypothetical protein